MVTARQIIDRFGGTLALSKLMGVDRSTVIKWTRPKPQGTGGRFPGHKYVQLLDAAKAAGVSLTIEEVMRAGLSEDDAHTSQPVTTSHNPSEAQVNG